MLSYFEVTMTQTMMMVMMTMMIMMMVMMMILAIVKILGCRNLENESVYDVRVLAINRLGSSNYSKVFNFYVKTTRKCNLTAEAGQQPSKKLFRNEAIFPPSGCDRLC